MAEFPTIGAYAWRFMSDKYHWINQETEARPKDKILNFGAEAQSTPPRKSGTLIRK